jgi:hypothetical protein
MSRGDTGEQLAGLPGAGTQQPVAARPVDLLLMIARHSATKPLTVWEDPCPAVATRANYSLVCSEGTFRCPTWAPAFNNKGTDHCVVEVWLKGDTEGWAGNGFFWNIPADGRWYAVLSEAWDAQQDNRFHDVWINTNGYPMDVDVVWVQSGI